MSCRPAPAASIRLARASGCPARATRHSGSSRSGSTSNSPRSASAGSCPIATSSVPCRNAAASTSLVLTSTNTLRPGRPCRTVRSAGATSPGTAPVTEPTRSLPLAPARERRDLVARLGQVGQHAARVADHRVAVGRGLHAPREAIEERHAEGVLELGQHPRGRRLRHRDVLRRLPQAAVLGDRHEQRELPRLQPRAQVPVGRNRSLHAMIAIQ